MIKLLCVRVFALYLSVLQCVTLKCAQKNLPVEMLAGLYA